MAIGTAGEVPASRGTWQQGVLRQSVTIRQWVWENAGAWRWEEMMCHERLVDYMCRTTGGQVRRVGLRAGSSPFLFLFGDDRVIRYTEADDDTGDAEDAQATE
ncbi:hypothetical protein DEO72_LG5g2691 [Vigna unguiculata]|uniref:Uncharacterized protein n=1 Tax=Vigna unguiculata TaxID=3917 RepID=A0A4D6M342_VIGUN|nr:hypothetical protein DEO72_LG5g2691 [Vigna unguiculata]